MKPKFKVGDEVYFISLFKSKIKKGKVASVEIKYYVEGEPIDKTDNDLFNTKEGLIKYISS